MNLTGGGAFYSLTPESGLKDLQGVNKDDMSFRTCFGISDVEGNEGVNKEKENPPYPPLRKRAKKAFLVRKVSRSDGRFENTLCHSEVKAEESQSRSQRMVYSLTPALSPWAKVLKPAFTLAEVLITLGIVGIIAAMTLPMLAENYQRRIVETRLKRFYTTFNQAILRSIDVNGPIDGWGYQVVSVYDESGNISYELADSISYAFDIYLRPYLNVVQTQTVIYTNGFKTYLYYLSDGSAFHYGNYNNFDIYYYPKDPIKCLKQSAVNRGGVCQFLFAFIAKKKVSGFEHNINKGLDPYKNNWDGTVESLHSKCESSGAFCTALIQYNDWQFPKDYPRKIRY